MSIGKRAPSRSVQPLIVITGPTASGKSSLAMYLAKKYHGEIICADSRTVYRGLDIGTAKPTQEDQRLVRHHLLDIADPADRFTVADFQRHANEAIKDIRARGKVPMMVGGTGLYIDSIVLGYRFKGGVSSTTRSYYEQFLVGELQSMIKNQHLPLPENIKNKRHLIRTLEQKGINSHRQDKPNESTLVVAITTDSHMLEDRIRQRAEEMFATGVVQEARNLANTYGWGHESLSGNIYPIIREYLAGNMTIEEAKERSVVKDKQLVKRQITWLKRHDFMQWMELQQAKTYLEEKLQPYRS